MPASMPAISPIRPNGAAASASPAKAAPEIKGRAEKREKRGRERASI